MSIAALLLQTARRFAAGVVLLGAIAVAAAEGDADASNEREQDAVEEPKEETPEKPDEDSGTLADVFTPSEEISEDIAVPFPVDI